MNSPRLSLSQSQCLQLLWAYAPLVVLCADLLTLFTFVLFSVFLCVRGRMWLNSCKLNAYMMPLRCTNIEAEKAEHAS